jgi:hypothetical protein
MPLVQIYVKLLDEGTDVWRPVNAECVGMDSYRIVSENPDSKSEEWEFTQGQIVRCEERPLSGNQRSLVAVSKL